MFYLLITIGLFSFASAMFVMPTRDLAPATDAAAVVDKNLRKEVTEIWENFHKNEEVIHALSSKIDRANERIDSVQTVAQGAMLKATGPQHLNVTIQRPKRELPPVPKGLRRPPKK